MSAACGCRMTLEAFLDWEGRQGTKYEFDGFQPVAMTGATLAHATIQANLIGALRERLRGSPARVLGSDLKVMAAGSIRYPDAVVICSPMSADSVVATEPVVVFES